MFVPPFLPGVTHSSSTDVTAQRKHGAPRVAGPFQPSSAVCSPRVWGAGQPPRLSGGEMVPPGPAVKCSWLEAFLLACSKQRTYQLPFLCLSELGSFHGKGTKEDEIKAKPCPLCLPEPRTLSRLQLVK